MAEFDDQRGYGTVRDDDGTELFLHCTRIADGTRTIEVGAAVVFDVVPGHGGRWE
ncbi:MAG: cold shock protein, partial [Acidimicrobiaceae bacterium]